MDTKPANWVRNAIGVKGFVGSRTRLIFPEESAILDGKDKGKELFRYICPRASFYMMKRGKAIKRWIHKLRFLDNKFSSFLPLETWTMDQTKHEEMENCQLRTFGLGHDVRSSPHCDPKLD